MRDAVGGRATVEVDGETAREALEALMDRFPQVRERLLDARGALSPHLAVLVDGTELESLDTPLRPDSELVITPALGGGVCPAPSPARLRAPAARRPDRRARRRP